MVSEPHVQNEQNGTKTSKNPGSERRQHATRRSASGEVKLGISLANGSVQIVTGRLVDVSDFGVGVETDTPFLVGTSLTVSSRFFGAESALRSKAAQVVHCRVTEQGTYRSGLAFDQTSSENNNGKKEKARRPTPTRDAQFNDYYEALQISSNADTETIQRVYRLLAQRYHPDNADSGNEEAFRTVLAAYRVLSDPEKRAAYDAKYKVEHSLRWQIFSQNDEEEEVGVVDEKRTRTGILSALYKARQRQPDQPDMTLRELESLLGCPREHLNFSIWYLRGKGLIERGDSGRCLITPDGVDRLEESDEFTAGIMPRLLEEHHD
jgi:hypothetical protein